MKIIAFEGIDKSGKHTQSSILFNRLCKDGFKSELSEFHRYDQPTGRLIRDWLTKQYNVSQKTIELIMAADKQAQQEWFHHLEKNGCEYLVLDRYLTSQTVYGEVAGGNAMWISDLQRFMEPPDLEILLDIPADVSYLRANKRGANDRYEENIEFLHKVRMEYLSCFYDKMRIGYGLIIDGTRDTSEIAESIYEFVMENKDKKENNGVF